MLSLTPNLQDVQLKKLLIAQMLLLIPALFAMTATIRRWGRHIRRKDLALRRMAAAKAAASTDGEALEPELIEASTEPENEQAEPYTGDTLPAPEPELLLAPDEMEEEDLPDDF